MANLNEDEHIDEMRIDNFSGGEFMVRQVIETDRIQNIPHNTPPAAPPSLPRRVHIGRVENASMFVGQKIKLTGSGPENIQPGQGYHGPPPPPYSRASTSQHPYEPYYQQQQHGQQQPGGTNSRNQASFSQPPAYAQQQQQPGRRSQQQTHRQVEEITVRLPHLHVSDAQQDYGDRNLHQGGFVPSNGVSAGSQASDDIAGDEF